MMYIYLIIFAVILLFIGLSSSSKNKGTSVSPSKGDSSIDDMDNNASGLSEGIEMARQHAEKIGDTEALQAIANGTYKELLEQRAAKRQSATAPSIAIYSYNIAGINFRRGIRDYVGQSKGFLKPQPTNRHDPNAIAVYSSDNHHLGYIPADETDVVRNLHLKFPIPVAIDIEECYDSDDRRFFVGTVIIKVKSKK